MKLPQIKSVDKNNIVKITLSGNGREDGKIITVKGEKCVCFEKTENKKAFHENVPLKNLEEALERKIEKYGNLTVFTYGRTYSFKISKKKKLLFNSFNNTLCADDTEKKHTLPLSVPPLYELGVTTKDGKLISGMRDKYVQIDRFAEFIVKAVEKLEKQSGGKIINIADAGCGKAYLSLAVYHCLKYDLNKNVSLKGIDLKEDVIKELNSVAEKYGYDGAEFFCEDLKTASLKNTDILISLHACDTATDYALYSAVKNDVPVILCAPCCQQEVCAEMKTPIALIEKYGLIKERFAALFTDALRAEILSALGYKTRITEFVGAHNTPKNMMIIAEKGEFSGQIREKARKNCENAIKFLGTENTLYRLVKEYL